KVIRLLCIAVVAVAAGGTVLADARADDPPPCPSSIENAYTMTTRALTGPNATDVELRLTAAAGCAAVERVDKVQVKTFTESGKIADVRNVRDVNVADGVATVPLDRVERGRRIETDVLVQTGTPPRTYVLRGVATSLLRPDLKITVPARVQTLI